MSPVVTVCITPSVAYISRDTIVHLCALVSVAGWAIAVGTLSILTLDIGWAVAEIACSWTKILDIISCGFALVSLFGALVFWKLNYQKTQPQEGRFIVSLQTMQTMFVLITTGNL